MLRKYFVYFICLVLLGVTACGELTAGLSKKIKYPQEVTPEIQRAFDQAENLYRMKNHDQAFDAYRDFAGKYAYSRLTDEARYKMGKIHFLKAEYAAAHGIFSQLAKSSPDPEYRAKAGLLAASSSFQQGESLRTLAELKEIKEGGLPVKLRVQFYSLVILSTQKSNSDQDFAHYSTVKLFETYEEGMSLGLQSLRGNDIVDYGRSRSLMEAWMTSPMKVADITNWMRRYPKNSAGRGYIDYKIGKAYAEEGNGKKARQILSDFVLNYPKNPYAGSAEKLLANLGGMLASTGKKRKVHVKVGLILPLSGPLGTYGQEVISGVRCAAGTLGMCGEDSGAELIVRDAGSGPEAVNLAIQELKEQGVSAIIGPMAASLAVPAAITASGYKIPIFPITQKNGLMQQGDYVFQIGMTAEQQINRLVAFARGKGMKRFAILAPNSEYGSTFATLFINAVTTQGGEIVARVSYAPGVDATDDTNKLKQAIPLDGNGKPGCDAVFVPDSYAQLNALIMPLESSGFGGLPLLGTNAWNDGRINLDIAAKFPGSFFVDMYSPNDSSQANQEFKGRYSQAFGSSPTILSALGYDTMQFILRASSQNGAAAIQTALAGRIGNSGVTMLRGFDVGKEPIVEPVMLKITETGIHE